MGQVLIRALLVIALATTGVLSAQNASRLYRLDFFGISYTLPPSYYISSEYDGGEVQGRVLLFASQRADRQVLLTAEKVSFRQLSGNLHVDERARTLTIISDASVVGSATQFQAAGRDFFRIDIKDRLPRWIEGRGYYEQPLFKSLVCTERRGYWLDWTMTADSPEELNVLLASLNQLSFEDDQRDLDWQSVKNKYYDDYRSYYHVPSAVAVSASVMEGYLVKKVTPIYPADANVTGTVVMLAVIGKDGSVQKLDVVSGHPTLFAVALNAAKQYKYRPYVINGLPCVVETKISIPFTPPKKH